MPDQTTHHDGMAKCVASLPETSLTIEDQARSVLGFLFAKPSPSLGVIVARPSCCPNCDSPATSTRSPYCSAYCREVSAFVRQFRHGLNEGSILNEGRQVALGQKLWHIAGGGYPLRISLISEKDKLKIIAKKGGLCEVCGASATVLDNVGSG